MRSRDDWRGGRRHAHSEADAGGITEMALTTDEERVATPSSDPLFRSSYRLSGAGMTVPQALQVRNSSLSKKFA